VQTFTITTTYTDRRRTIATNENLSGRLWRIVPHPGTSGLFKLWDWSMDAIKEPASLTIWSAYSQGFGYKGYKLIKQIWIDLKSSGPVTVTLTALSTGGVFSITIPAHPTRAAERFLLPSVWGSGLNKSTLYDLEIIGASGQTFQLWADVCGIEFIPCGQDRHLGYTQFPISEMSTVTMI
jgi:hypothetical protein